MFSYRSCWLCLLSTSQGVRCQPAFTNTGEQASTGVASSFPLSSPSLQMRPERILPLIYLLDTTKQSIAQQHPLPKALTSHVWMPFLESDLWQRRCQRLARVPPLWSNMGMRTKNKTKKPSYWTQRAWETKSKQIKNPTTTLKVSKQGSRMTCTMEYTLSISPDSSVSKSTPETQSHSQHTQ